ncbi:Acyl-CoA desaturase [Frankliniella fusca]|uniref:Acyl-CoA desaturase n=1 Tax=Frankliniella fusca TaxID=407009 RepID=A0AAE1LJP3_9NEOP|nr:Acyl-CoA desaturase [Frankliniella fusca]
MALLIVFVSGMAVLLGAHRLYSHRSYKATFLLRLLVVLWHTVSSQNCLWVWVRDHRQHHKYSDTDADPHNARRGFFFSHIGWLMVRKHPAVFEAGRKVDMSDIEADWLVMFQKKYNKNGVPEHLVAEPDPEDKVFNQDEALLMEDKRTDSKKMAASLITAKDRSKEKQG